MYRKNLNVLVLIALLLGMTLAACQGSSGSEGNTEEILPTPTAPALKEVTEQPEITEAATDQLVELAKIELAELLDVGTEQITLESVTTLDENNNIYSIKLHTDSGELYEYHGQDNTVLLVSEPLPTAPAEAETAEPEPLPTDEVTITETAVISPEQITFALDELATVVVTETVAATEDTADTPFWDVYPAHLQFTFEDYVLSDALQPAHLVVYPVDAYVTMSETAADQIERLRALLAEQPETITAPIPYLPLTNANQFMWTRAAYLDFPTGSGIRYLTQFSQAVVPVNNEELFYTFQGLTEDEDYYVAAVFPVNHPDLPLNPGDIPAEFEESFDTYLADVITQLDEADAASFTPDLALLDAFIQSIAIESDNVLVTDAASLMRQLEAAGAAVTENGTQEQPFFSVPAQVWQINDAEIQVFEFESRQPQQAAAASIQDNGYVIGNTAVDWIDTPHFWANGQLIVLYIGTDETVINLLTNTLGMPIIDEASVIEGDYPAAVADALDLFSQSAGIDASEIEVVYVTETEWSDGCLGLAEEGEACTLAIVPGFQIIAQAQGEEYEIRTNRSGTVMRWQFASEVETVPYP